MTDQLRDIGRRLFMLRDAQDLTAAEMAAKLGESEGSYVAYEGGERDFSFSFLYNAANILGVDVLDIISGESPKLSTCCLVRKGGGFAVNRREAYDYMHLAFTFRDKKAEPFMVSVEPGKEGAAELIKHAHDGQEFNYMVEGSMEFHIGDMTYELGEGDSVYFDSGTPHAMRATGKGTARFLAVVLK